MRLTTYLRKEDGVSGVAEANSRGIKLEECRARVQFAQINQIKGEIKNLHTASGRIES